jgi:hypothetical protein
MGDFADPSAELLARLRDHRPNGVISAGAFGGKQAPATSFLNALALLTAATDGKPVDYELLVAARG